MVAQTNTLFAHDSTLRTAGRIARINSLQWIGRVLIECFMQMRLKIDGRRYLDLPQGPKVIVANHPTTTDPFYVTTLTAEPMHILITGGAFQIPIFGRFLRACGHVPVIEGNGRLAFDEARRLLEAGRTITIFPEGALSPLRGGIHPPRSGAARLALCSGAPVIPVGIGLQRERIQVVEIDLNGEDTVGHLYLRGPYAITVGEPLHFQGDAEDRAQVHAVSASIMQHITSLSQASTQRLAAASTSALQANPIGLGN